MEETARARYMVTRSLEGKTSAQLDVDPGFIVSFLLLCARQ